MDNSFVMEYTFRNGNREKTTTIRLDADALRIITGDIFRSVGYDEIIEVRLNHKKNLYFMIVTTLDEGVLKVTNYTYDHTGKRIDQSRAYMTFVRVLHVHLAEKSKAVFQTGSDVSTLMLRVLFIIGISALCFIIAGYYNLLPEKPVFILALFALPAVFLIHTLRVSQWPKTYSSINVPIHLLPPAA